MSTDTCPRCGSENVVITPAVDDDTGETIEDLEDGKCSDCGLEYVICDL